jgi:mRNA interferase RelE/StbE
VEPYRLSIKTSARRELESIAERSTRQGIVRRIEALADQPRPHGSEKLGGGEDRYRIRQGSYRVVYAISDRERTVTVVKIGHRREVYR